MGNILQKILRILEMNVEWIALGLGVAFLGFMAWSYLINPPVVAVIGGTRLTPGDVDDYIANGPLETLKQKMSDPQVPTFQVQDFSTLISQRLAPPPTPMPALASVWDWQPSQITTNGPQQANQGPTITVLPQLPAASPLLLVAGQSSIVSPGAAAAAPAANPTNPPAPGAGRTDVHWIMAAFSVPVAQLTDQWNKSFGPPAPGQPPKLNPASCNTFFLDVTGFRREQLPNGQWGPDEPVERLANNVVQPFPVNGQKVTERQYLVWASPHFADIATPPFPALAAAPAGSAWQDPGQVLQGLIGANGAAPAPAAAQPAAGNPPDPDQQILPAKPLPAVVPTPPGAGFNFAPAAAPAGGAATATPDMLIYFIDFVEPGKTYEYSLNYKLANPVFDLPPARVANPNWAAQLALAAPTSDYTQPVSIAPQTYFYCAAGTAQGAGGFPFDVFTWAAGLWQQQQFIVKPGDPIGGIVGGVDFSTKNTYVDGKARNQDFYVTVVDDDGIASVRKASADAESADHKAKMQWVNQSKATTTPSGGTDSPGGNNNSDQ
jgi:hypothetical protein